MVEETDGNQLRTSVETWAFQLSPEDFAELRPKASPVVLFTGAGASVPLDMPTMVGFRKRFLDRLTGNQKVLWENVVMLTAKNFEEELSGVNIEQVLTYIERCLFSYSELLTLWRDILQRNEGDPLPTIPELEEFRQLLWTTRTDILDEICATYAEPDPSKTISCYEPLFKMLAETAGQSVTNVFTTNYDLTFETLVTELPDDYELSDGFRKDRSGEEVWQNDYVPTCQKKHSIVLRKLHGSTSWKGNWARGELRKASPSTYIQDGEQTVIIYPTKTKADTQDLFARPFNQAYGSLDSLFMQVGSVEVLLVIGYGFGDDELRGDIEEGLVAEDKAFLVVVDPGADISKLSRDFCRVSTDRIRVIKSYFGPKETIEEIRSVLEALLSEESPQL